MNPLSAIDYRPLRRLMFLSVALAHCMNVLAGERSSAQESPVAEADLQNGASDRAANIEASHPEPFEPSSDAPSASRIEYVGPDTYILLDAEGRPQPMPGMSYEDFMAAWRQVQKLDARASRPRFSIEAAEFQGRALDRHAELRITFTIRLLTDQRTAVPLGLANAILQRPSRFERLSNQSSHEDRPQRDAFPYLHHDAQQGGYIVWFDAKPTDEYTVEMNVLVPLARNGAARTLQLSCPRALTSKLSLSVDQAIADVTVSDGALVNRDSSTSGRTQLEVVGVAGQFALTWTRIEAEIGEPATVLSASGKIDVSIDGRSAQSQAQLVVQSFGGDFDRFRVRLPRGAKLIQAPEDGSRTASTDGRLRVSVEPDTALAGPPNGDSHDRQIVLVELPEKQQGPIELNLTTEQPLGMFDEELAVEVGSFEVLGAVRQFGDVALRIADDWQSQWDTSNNVRQVDPSDLAASLRQADVTAAFQYDRQPWSLGVRLAAQNSQIHVSPEYELECLPDEARLRTRLIYQVLGQREFDFRVDLKGWKLTADPIESGGLVDGDRLLVTREDMLVLPLLQASPRRAEIAFTLRRSTPRDQERLTLPLPVPRADSVTSGTLTVRAAPGLELVPDIARSPGLAAVPAVTSDSSAASPEEFRYRTFLPELVFIADRISRPREVTSEVTTRATLTDSDVEIVQRINYSVSYEPIQQLDFEVPEELVAIDPDVEVSFLAGRSDDTSRPAAETPLPIRPVADEPVRPDTSSPGSMRATLAQPRIGQFAIVIRYTVPRSPMDEDSARILVPLIQPAEGRVTAQRADIRTLGELSIDLHRGRMQTTWRAQPQSPGGRTRPATFIFAAAGREARLPLSTQPIDVSANSTTSIERVWLQAWIAGDIRQDRAVFQIRTTGPAVTVELPPDTSPDQVEARLDGAPVKAVTREPGRLVVWLSESTPNSPDAAADANELHTLELRYQRPSANGLVARHLFSPPQLVGSDGHSQVYWHVVLPGDTHIVQSPRNLASVSAWQWLGSFWGTRPVKSQRELEDWVSASEQLEPTAAQNEYLYTGLAPVMSIEVVTAPRWLIVVLVSSALLAVTLLWIFVPYVRSGWLLFGLACTIAALAIAFPTPAILLGQAAALGVVLSLVAGLLARLTARPSLWSQPSRASGSSLRNLTSRAESVLGSPISAAASSAPTASLRTADSQL